MSTIDTLPLDKPIGHANTGTSFRQNKGYYHNLANAAGGSAGVAVTTVLTFSEPLPSIDYGVHITASQACFTSWTSKTVSGVSIVLTPKDGSTTLASGTFDVEIDWNL